jgi:hypothetical protein
VWFYSAWSFTGFNTVGLEWGFGSYKCLSGNGPRCQGLQVQTLVGLGFDVSTGGSAGFVFGAKDGSVIESWSSGVDFNFSPGAGFGGGLYTNGEAVLAYFSAGWGFGFHVAGGPAYGFDMNCTLGY